MIALRRALKEQAVQSGAETVEVPEPVEEPAENDGLRIDGLRLK
jgi:hypothetical protein